MGFKQNAANFSVTFVTLGILPYVTKLEKFLLAGLSSYDDVSLYHVAQLAWIAGLMLPQAIARVISWRSER